MKLKKKLYNFQFNLRQSLIGRYYKISKINGEELDVKTYNPQKVLFVMAGLLGDTVMSVPAITESRKLWNDAHFTVLGKRHNNELLAGCPAIDEFYECSADPFSIRQSRDTKTLQGWLKSENFDLAIILLGNQFAHLLAKANIPIRIGVAGTRLEACLTHKYDIGSPRDWGASEKLNSIRCLGYSVGNVVPKLCVQENARATLQKKLLTFGLKHNQKYVVLHPFGSTFRQWWNIDNIEPLAKKLFEKFNLQTVLIGGKETTKFIDGRSEDIIIDTTGKLSLAELLAIIDGSNLVITTDSGPYHIAGALKKPIIGLFRSSRPEHGLSYPTSKPLFGKNNACQNTCKWDFCGASKCLQLQNISVKMILDEVKHQT